MYVRCKRVRAIAACVRQHFLAEACTSRQDLSVCSSAAQAMLVPSRRVAHLETLVTSLADSLAWTQSMPALKRCAEVLAKSQGATFAKVWRAKPAASIFSKLNFRRGQTVRSWLTDGLQGRIICDDLDHVAQVAAFFEDIMHKQADAVKQARGVELSSLPTGDEIAAYDPSKLQTEHGPAEAVSTYVHDMAAEGAGQIVLPAYAAGLPHTHYACSVSKRRGALQTWNSLRMLPSLCIVSNHVPAVTRLMALTPKRSCW
jgi:hypothetical protein